MQIERVSAFSGKTHTLDLPITEEQIAMWRAGFLIQDAMPHLSPSQREFLITGTTPEEWDEMFKLGDEDE